MLSGWSTAGHLGCPYCMEDTKTFWLLNGKKQSYFDCHRRFLPANHPYRRNKKNFIKGRVEKSKPVPYPRGADVLKGLRNIPFIWDQAGNMKLPGFGETHNWTKKSVFWILPYWKDNLIRHNLDVMHTEKNVFENIFNTVMDVKGKSKDNGARCRNDVKLHCDRPELEIRRIGGKYVGARAKYQLKVKDQIRVLQWLHDLQFPDGYSSRLSRHVDIPNRKLSGYKSHDAHVILERLMAIAFRGMLPDDVWRSVSELATFFRDTCASSLDKSRMRYWKDNIAVTLCKLEMFFPPSFFDSMEHLPIHLAQETLLGGPVHYRWMYPFERFIYRLKRMVTNKAKPEASMVNAFVQLEISFLGSDYLGPEYKTKVSQPKRNEIIHDVNDVNIVSTFNHPGSRGKVIRVTSLSEDDYRKAQHYIFTNTPEFDEYVQLHTQNAEPRPFSKWIKDHMRIIARNQSVPEWLFEVSMGFDWRVSTTATYKINNYRFRIESECMGRTTVNCHLLVRGGDGTHYYGVLEEILIMSSLRTRAMTVVLFRCRWFHPRYVTYLVQNGITEVNINKPLGSDEPFILAQQAEQVYFTEFPGQPRRAQQGWFAVCPVKPTNAIDLALKDIPYQADTDFTTEIPDSIPIVEVTEVHANGFQEYSDDEDEGPSTDNEMAMYGEFSSDENDDEADSD